MSQPIHFVIHEKDFDLSLLPPEARTPGTPGFRKHVTDYVRQQYAQAGGETTVEFTGGSIAVTWTPDQATDNPMQAILQLLNEGRYGEAEPILKTLLQANPKDHEALYNLGMVYSDQGRLPEACDLLRRATVVDPDHANSWVALGVAALRANDVQQARPALERAVELEPDNPFALRTLGSLSLMAGDPAQAVPPLRRAADLSPQDPVTRLTLAQALLEQDADQHAHEADTLLQSVLRLAPPGEIAEKAKDLRRKIAGDSFRDHAIGGLRPDAVMYCVDALERFSGKTQAELAPLVMEMAALGEKGLPVNDPDQRFRLRLIEGEFSGLQIVCMMHVGLKLLDPKLGSGFDIDREYATALTMHKNKNSP
jgi:Flp pilus assembly protein TadD